MLNRIKRFFRLRKEFQAKTRELQQTKATLAQTAKDKEQTEQKLGKVLQEKEAVLAQTTKDKEQTERTLAQTAREKEQTERTLAQTTKEKEQTKDTLAQTAKEKEQTERTLAQTVKDKKQTEQKLELVSRLVSVQPTNKGLALYKQTLEHDFMQFAATENALLVNFSGKFKSVFI